MSLALASVIGLSAGVTAGAASFSDINANSVFLKQHTSVTCTLSSTAMIMRRTAIIAGYSDWEEITEANIRSAGWVNGIGLLWNFSCYDMTVGHGYFSGTDNKDEMLLLLEKYPQGIVVYNGGNGGQSHAVVLTDYDEKSDTFYVADPSSQVPWGRIKFTDSSILGKTQKEQIENLTSYWYVSSPTVELKNGNYTISGRGGSVSGSDGQGSYNPDSDTAIFNSSKTSVDSYYVVSEDSSKGIALRYYPSGSSDAVKYVHKGTILYITYTGKNNFGAVWAKTSDGYYIFTDNITPFEEYSAEIIKFNNTAKSSEGTYKVNSHSDIKAPLRLEPSEGNNIVGYADNQSKLYITHSGVNSVGASWLRTGEGYYVKASDMEFVSAAKENGTSFSGDIIRVTGEYSAKPIADDYDKTEKFPMAFKITASALNMRKSPVDGEVILSIPRNTIVYVTAIVSGWGLTEYHGQSGWISLDYAVKTDDSAPLAIESISLSSDRLETGREVVCSVKVSAGVDCRYKFSVFNNSGSIVYSGEFSASNSFTYKPKKAGIYYFAVDVTDPDGDIVSGYSADFIVHDKLRIDSVMTSADEYSYVYEPICWTVEASDLPDNVVYNYSLFLDGGLIFEKSSVSNEFEYTPEKMGKYTLKVTLSDGFVSSEEAAASVDVYDVLSISSIKLNTSLLPVGNEVVCSVAASGGTGSYLYCFSVFKNGELMQSGSYSGDSEYRCSFSEAGTYSIFCAVSDSGNMIVSAFSAEITVTDYISGDVDLNGKVTSSDARLALRHSAGLITLTGSSLIAADVNGDGRITASDARTILRIAAKLV